ncbi:MAG: MarR family transcriptional regulator [Microbacterium sp.]|nr:MAG: MarR family transcriptional regulator [Microbacterium sp.]
MPTSRQEAIVTASRAMQRYQRSVQQFDDAVGRALGLNAADMRCLDCLSERPHTAGEISVATGLRPAATTALIDRLSARGLTRRVPPERDRRQVLVELTEEGAARVWEAYGPLVEHGADVFAGVGAEEIAAMSRVLERMTDLTDLHRTRIQEG